MENIKLAFLVFVFLSIADLQSTETFRTIGGASIVVGILNDGGQSLDVLNSGFSVVAAASTGNEILKESFMELKIDELILQILNRQSKGSIQSLYDAIRVLLTPDDNRVVASQVSPKLSQTVHLHFVLAILRRVKLAGDMFFLFRVVILM